MIQFVFTAGEITPVMVFMIGLGGFNYEIHQLKRGDGHVQFTASNWQIFKQAYLEKGHIKKLKARLENA